MRLSNLSNESKNRVGRDLFYLKEVLQKELEATKSDIIFVPSDKIEELRGRAKVLTLIISLI